MASVKTISLLTALFPFSLAVPVAHADSIDDFVLTGNGETITFSLPSDPPGNQMTCPPTSPSCLPGSETAFYVEASVDTNNVITEEELAFPTFGFGGGLEIGQNRYLGSQLFAPDAANPVFTPGTYTLGALSFPPEEFTLTITPETSTTPEPASLLLLATGALGLSGTLARRYRRS